jgi:hypothetical protein
MQTFTDEAREYLHEIAVRAPEAQGSGDYARGRRDGYALGVEHGEQNRQLTDAARYFAAGALLMAAILLPFACAG